MMATCSSADLSADLDYDCLSELTQQAVLHFTSVSDKSFQPGESEQSAAGLQSRCTKSTFAFNASSLLSTRVFPQSVFYHVDYVLNRFLNVAPFLFNLMNHLSREFKL